MYKKEEISVHHNGGVLTITFPNGDVYSLSSCDPRYRKAIAALNAGDYSPATFTSVMNLREELTRWGAGKVVVDQDSNVMVVKNGIETKVSDTLGKILREYVHNGLPVEAFANGIIRLMSNPSTRSRDLFCGFAQLYGLSFTKDGMCRAYKAITWDWKDKHTRSVDNRIGVTTRRMTRHEADDNPDNACSAGFHCGSIEYVKGFASGYGREGGDRIVIVEFDPADVVCVPRDCSQQKIRCLQYTVVEEFKGILAGYSDFLQSDMKYTDEGDEADDSIIDFDALERQAACFLIGFSGCDQATVTDDDVCPACGETIPDEASANYCSYCGEKLN